MKIMLEQVFYKSLIAFECGRSKYPINAWCGYAPLFLHYWILWDISNKCSLSDYAWFSILIPWPHTLVGNIRGLIWWGLRVYTKCMSTLQRNVLCYPTDWCFELLWWQFRAHDYKLYVWSVRASWLIGCLPWSMRVYNDLLVGWGCGYAWGSSAGGGGVGWGGRVWMG